MKNVLYLMHHGETLFNKLHKIQGLCDSPLTATEIQQAKIAGEYFRNNKIFLMMLIAQLMKGLRIHWNVLQISPV